MHTYIYIYIYSFFIFIFKYSLNHKFYQRLRQFKFIREYRDIFELTKPLNK